MSVGASPIYPGTVVSLLQGAYFNYRWRPPADMRTYRAIRAGLREAGVDDFVLEMRRTGPGLVVAEMTAALDRRPVATDGVLVSYEVPSDLGAMSTTSH